MHAIILTGLAVFLATMNVQALPRVKTPLPRAKSILSFMDDVPIWHPSPRNGNATRGPLRARQNDIDTRIEIGDTEIIAQDGNAEPGESPQAFAQLFDYLESDLCGTLGCQFGETYCVEAAAGADVCIEARGEYGTGMREDFLQAVRGAFDRTVTSTELSSGVMETGTNVVHVISENGPNSGFGLRVQLTNQASGGEQCPAFIENISNASQYLPEIGAVFGLVGFACGLAGDVEHTAEATG